MFKKLFIRHLDNGYIPSIIKFSAIFSYLLFVVFFNILSLKYFTDSPSKIAASQVVDIPTLYQLINQDRVSDGLPTLNINTQLQSAALAHGDDMFLHQYWGHVSPQGVSYTTFIANSGYIYKYAGENLAINFSSASDVNQAWMNSPDHRSNILDSNYKDMGIASITGTLDGVEQTIIVQLFASPPPSMTSTPVYFQPVSNTSSNIISEQQFAGRNVLSIQNQSSSKENLAVVGSYGTVLGKGQSVVAIPEDIIAPKILVYILMIINL